MAADMAYSLAGGRLGISPEDDAEAFESVWSAERDGVRHKQKHRGETRSRRVFVTLLGWRGYEARGRQQT